MQRVIDAQEYRIRDATREGDVACSVSESLAHGLVTRLTGEIEAARTRLDAHTRLQISTTKRAATYRATKAYLDKAIPPELVLHRHSRGDQSGKDKDARHLVTHWGLLYQAFGASKPPQDGLELAVTVLNARHATLWSERICVVARHAVMRLFFRLRTSKPTEVLAELRELGHSVFLFHAVLQRLPWGAQLLLPSRRGAFVIVRDRTGEASFAVLTWMSDERMSDNMRRHNSVIRARAEEGLVVNYPNAFPIISNHRLAKLASDEHAPVDARLLNRLSDRFFHESTRLPAQWRFQEKDNIPTQPPVDQLTSAS